MTLENVEDVYSLTPTQQGMLYHSLENSGSGVYVVQLRSQLAGVVDERRFHDAWRRVVERHPAMRQAFFWEDLERPVQVVRQQVTIRWRREDLRPLSASRQQEWLDRYEAQDRAQGFAVDEAPLMRFVLARTADAEWTFLWSFHHLLLDGWSVGIVFNEALAIYGRLPAEDNPGLPSRRSFRDFVAWQLQQSRDAAEAYWRSLLNGLTDNRSKGLLPAEPSPSTVTRRRYLHALPAGLTNQLQECARQQRITLNTIIVGAWAILCHHYQNSDDVVFGVTLSGRPPQLAGVGEMIGMFINTVPLRARIREAQPVIELLKQVQLQQVESTQYDYVSLTDIQRWIGAHHGQRLLHSTVVFESVPVRIGGGELEFDVGAIEYQDQSEFPLALLIMPETELQLRILYDQRLSAAAVREMAEHLTVLLAEICRDPHQATGVIRMLSEAQEGRLSARMGPQREFPRDRCIHELFQDAAQRDPEQTAAVFAGARLTYGELDGYANQLARELVSSGVAIGDYVCICVERSFEMLAGMLGILKAGAAYVPIDPEYPLARRVGLVREIQDHNSGSTVVVTTPAQREQLEVAGVKAVLLNGRMAHRPVDDGGQPSRRPDPDDPAYVIYTSGSTGQPKGVVISHRSLVHSTTARFDFYHDPVKCFLLLSPYAFDSSVGGIFWTLCQGGTLILPAAGEERDIGRLANLIRDYDVTHTLALPALYEVLLDHVEDAGMLSSLRTVIVAGEACPGDLAGKHVSKLPEAELYNEYGPTESAVWCTACKLRPEQRVTIGVPISNTEVWLLNDRGQPVPDGTVGEICIGGEGLAKGYLGRPELTAEKFVNVIIGRRRVRLYRSGDLGRCVDGGQIEFCGRADGQVKIRGHRIELGEIEAVLRDHPAVSEVVVVAQQLARTPDMSEDPQRCIDLLTSLDHDAADRLLREIEEQP